MIYFVTVNTIITNNKLSFHLQNVISEGAGGDMVSHYKSIIYYHEDKPKWFETVKVRTNFNFLMAQRASETHFAKHLCGAPCQGWLWQCALRCLLSYVADYRLWLLPLPSR